AVDQRFELAPVRLLRPRERREAPQNVPVHFRSCLERFSPFLTEVDPPAVTRLRTGTVPENLSDVALAVEIVDDERGASPGDAREGLDCVQHAANAGRIAWRAEDRGLVGADRPWPLSPSVLDELFSLLVAVVREDEVAGAFTRQV